MSYNHEEFSKNVKEVCDGVANLLIEKNKSYGNSALDPIHCFYKGTATDAIKVRLDDKLSRLMRGNEFDTEDTVLDLMGYLVLLKISLKKIK